MSHDDFVYWSEAAAEFDPVFCPPNFWSVSSVVAYDRYNDDVKYSAVTQFVREADGGIHYMFALAKRDDREGTDFIVNSKVACAIIPTMYRPAILNVFVRNTGILLNSYAPSNLIMETALPSLEERQLVKYDLVLETFYSFGYAVHSRQLDNDGYLTWQLAQAQ